MSGSSDPRATPPALGEEDLRAVAKLARLELDPSEAARRTEDLSRIVALAASLAEVLDEPGFDALEPFVHESDAAPLRADVPAPSLSNEVVLAEAPRAADGGFAVPAFVDEG